MLTKSTAEKMIKSCTKRLLVFFVVLWAAPLLAEGVQEVGLEEQMEVLVNRLKCLELENAQLQEGTWLVTDQKAKKRILLIILGVVALNVAIWGAVKLYHHLNRRKEQAIEQSREIRLLTQHFAEQNALIQQLRRERDDAVGAAQGFRRERDRLIARMRQLYVRRVVRGEQPV